MQQFLNSAVDNFDQLRIRHLIITDGTVETFHRPIDALHTSRQLIFKFADEILYDFNVQYCDASTFDRQ